MNNPIFESKFQIEGTRVRFRHDSGLVGVCTGRVDMDEDGLLVHVRFPGQQAQFEMAEDLELVEDELDERAQVLTGRFARSGHLRKRLTSVQLAGQLSEMIYSLDTTDTKFMPHQFKPLLALLDSPSKGILIADEVGLGKTIEAGLIWTELRFRTNASRMLVVCPAVLMEKWKSELKRRFGTSSQFMTAQELLSHLEQGESANKVPAIICSLQGIRPPTDSTDDGSESQSASARLARFLDGAQDQTIFDLVVIDEAHYLRNHETSSAFLGQLLRPVADYFVLLSATPVNNRSRDLFNLVSLVDPDQFRFEQEFDSILEANRPLIRLSNMLKRADVTVGMVRQSLFEAKQHWMFTDSSSLNLLLEDIESNDDDEVIPPDSRVEISHRIERINLLGQTVVRSRKREVLENRVERKVRNYSIEMTTVEQEFYVRVTDAVVDYALKNSGAQGFLLATPQRQMSSSMFSSAYRWLITNREPDAKECEEFAYDAFGEDLDDDASSVSKHVARALSGHVDVEALRLSDSKYNKLESLLRRFFEQFPNEKAIVFSYFRDTLDYLQERLDLVGIPSMVVKGGDDKQSKIDEFSESKRFKVLLASEVAAEGVDLQFMRFLVNYDLPWNPMRIEQRIGRIDRIGQESDAISIANLVYKDTIDDRILTKLFEKLRIFEDSLGCTEDVLQDGIGILTRDLLSRQMTPDQQVKRIDQTLVAIETNRKDMALIQEHEADFVGLGEFVRDRVTHAKNTHRRITDEDLQLHIKEYLEDHAPGFSMQMNPDGLTGTIMLPPETAARLRLFRENFGLPRSRLEGGGEVAVVIRNHVSHGSFSTRNELINQYHPLVRMVADADRKANENELVVAAELDIAQINLSMDIGLYAFSAEIWKFEGARREETIKASFISMGNGQPITGELAFDVLNTMRSQSKDWISIARFIENKEAAANCLEQSKKLLLRQYKETRNTNLAENSDRIRMQRQSLDRALKRRVEKLDQSIYRVIESRKATYTLMTQGKIKKLKEIHAVAIAQLELKEQPKFTRNNVISGFVRIYRA
jgi:superfamily II DNA or RNA helicase